MRELTFDEICVVSGGSGDTDWGSVIMEGLEGSLAGGAGGAAAGALTGGMLGGPGGAIGGAFMGAAAGALGGLIEGSISEYQDQHDHENGLQARTAG